LEGDDGYQVDHLAARGCLGISMPAGALGTPDRLDSIESILERTATRRLPLFVHPGPAPGGIQPETSSDEPRWWRAMTDYVAQMQAAWLTFVTHGRRAHPELVVIFAMLAGGAPLLTERLRARGGPRIDLDDPGLLYETSSYGPVAIQAMARQVGEARLLYGSDRPVIEPILTPRDAGLQRNAGAILARIGTTV
jgi:predicted TIM-barrel fold metal-dependent hydrolase